MTKSGTTIHFKYDHNGLRVGKVVNGTKTKYMFHGKLVTHLTVGSDSLHFFYDTQSRPAKVSFNGTVYTYIHNLQGDIVGILDSSGNLVVEYKYDAWGKPIATTGSLAATLGTRNPFRYRGYIYDEETELYYELCPQKWTFGHTKTDTYRFKEQFHRFETVMPETRYVDDVSH